MPSMKKKTLFLFCKFIINYIKLKQYKTYSLTHKSCSNINIDNLFLKLIFLKCSLTREKKSAIDIVNYLKKMDECFTNAYIIYKILLTISVTIVTVE